MLRFSIVIPNLNGGASLERAIRSVIGQEYPEVQLILADGGSNDESMSIAQRFSGAFSEIIHERDEGQADALNRAFRLATGDVHSWLCADDELLPGTLAHVAAMFERQPRLEVIAGACERVFDQNHRVVVSVPHDAWEIIGTRNVLDQPSVFWRSRAHQRAGELDTRLHLAFDWEFWCRLRRAGARLGITRRALARYHFSDGNKTSKGGEGHVAEGFEIVRRYGPRRGLAQAYRLIYRHFDLHGCLDAPPAATRSRRLVWAAARLAGRFVFGHRWMDLYSWHFASLQQRGLNWWERGHPKLWERGHPKLEVAKSDDVRESKAEVTVPTDPFQDDWTGGTETGPGDETLPGGLDRLNVALNRRRLAEFIVQFGEDADAHDFLLLDGLAVQTGLSINASGLSGVAGGLALRPFRWWEYVWLYKGLGLRAGGLRVLQIGGCVSHLGFLAAIAGNEVLAIDGDLRAVESANRAAAALGLGRFRAEFGNVSAWAREEAFDRVLSSSVIDRLTPEEQARAMSGVARALKGGGLAGLTFAYGSSCGSANINLPPPFSPLPDSGSAAERLALEGLRLAGQPLEPPVAGSLFRGAQARFMIASLFLSKGESAEPAVPRVSGEAPVMASARVPGLVRLACHAAKSSARRRRSEELEKAAWTDETADLMERCEVAEAAAADRLAALERVHREVQIMRGHEGNRLGGPAGTGDPIPGRGEAEKRLINKLTVAIKRKDREIAELRARLAGKYREYR